MQGTLIGESTGAGAMTAEYVFLNGNPYARIEGNSVYYYHNDHLGTSQRMTDSSMGVVWEGEFLSFGEPFFITGSIANNLRFPGQYYDQETGLHYNWNRYYDPRTGRYLTPDPIGLAGGMNLFLYTEGNPINFADPL